MSIVTAELRVYLKRQIDAIARERLTDEHVLFCSTCCHPYDKTRHGMRKLCGCNPEKGMGRKRSSRTPEEQREADRLAKQRWRDRRRAASPVAA